MHAREPRQTVTSALVCFFFFFHLRFWICLSAWHQAAIFSSPASPDNPTADYYQCSSAVPLEVPFTICVVVVLNDRRIRMRICLPHRIVSMKQTQVLDPASWHWTSGTRPKPIAELKGSIIVQ